MRASRYSGEMNENWDPYKSRSEQAKDTRRALELEAGVSAAPPKGWVELTKKNAKQHPLYGIRGWLMVLLVLHILWIFVAPVLRAGLLGHTAAPSAQWGGNFIVIGLILWKSRWLQSTYMLVYPGLTIFVAGVMVILSGEYEALPYGMDGAFVVGDVLIQLLVRDIPFTAYVLFSKRVNVTTKWRVRVSDPFLVRLAHLRGEDEPPTKDNHRGLPKASAPPSATRRQKPGRAPVINQQPLRSRLRLKRAWSRCKAC